MEDQPPQDSPTTFQKIKGWAVLIGIVMIMLNTCRALDKKHQNYLDCEMLWRSSVAPSEVTGYDSETGDPSFRWPKMPSEFRKNCR